MKYVIIVFLLVLVATFFSAEERFYSYSESDAVSPSAIQFVNFRSEIIKYLQDKNKHRDGIIEYDDITHDSWYKNDIWRARISSGICYIWGESSHEVYISIFKMLSYSMSLGISKNGNIVIRDYILPSPAFIPDGSIVSVIQLS